MNKKKVIDPEEERWNREYPKFPGVAKCVELLHDRKVRGSWVDFICYKLEQHAQEHAEELVAVTREEVKRKSGVDRILLHILADSKLPEALDLFVELLEAPDETLHSYGVDGLKQLDTKASRRALWQYESHDKRE